MFHCYFCTHTETLPSGGQAQGAPSQTKATDVFGAVPFNVGEGMNNQHSVLFGWFDFATVPLKDWGPLHKIFIWTQIRKIKRKSVMRDSAWLKIHLHLIFLICVQTQILCTGAIDPSSSTV